MGTQKSRIAVGLGSRTLLLVSEAEQIFPFADMRPTSTPFQAYCGTPSSKRDHRQSSGTHVIIVHRSLCSREHIR
jgi:hypothetical protein